MPQSTALITYIGFACLFAAACYGTLAVIAVLVWQRRAQHDRVWPLPAVSVLKPLCGTEPGLYDNLRSFCRQDFKEFQLVFGVSDGNDAALEAVRRLRTEFPALPIEVVTDARQHGSNCKISNLINMIARARHDVLVMADSDAFVGPDYLSVVTAPLRDEAVGLVTTLYRAVPTRTVYSRLGAMYINEWYMPSVLVAWLFGYQGYVSGQTLCMRRDTLRAIGGLEAIANHLADDHQIGARVHALAKRVVLSAYMPSAVCHEPSLQSLMGHEVRWMRTLHVLRPRSFPFIFLSFTVPLALLGLALTHSSAPLVWALFSVGLVTRLALHMTYRLPGKSAMMADLWLIPGRDLLLGWVWVKSLFTSRITWRGNTFDVDAEGVMRRLS